MDKLEREQFKKELIAETTDDYVRRYSYPKKGTTYWRIWEDFTEVLGSDVEKSIFNENYLKNLSKVYTRYQDKKVKLIYVNNIAVIAVLFLIFGYNPPMTIPYVNYQGISSGLFEVVFTMLFISLGLSLKNEIKLTVIKRIFQAFSAKNHSHKIRNLYLLQWGIEDIIFSLNSKKHEGYKFSDSHQNNFFVKFVRMAQGFSMIALVIVLLLILITGVLKIIADPNFGVISFLILAGSVTFLLSSFLDSWGNIHFERYYKEKTKF